jgi:uncharacterized protein
MMKTIAMVALVTAFSILPVFAQNESRRALAEELLDTMDMRRQLEQTFDVIKRIALEQAEEVEKSAAHRETSMDPPGLQEKVMVVLEETLGYENIRDDFVSIYAETFTEEEMRGIIAFYQSPPGQALLMKQPELTKRSMELSTKWMMEALPKIMEITHEGIHYFPSE